MATQKVIQLRFRLFREGAAWIAHCEGLDVATSADSIDQAIAAAQVATRLFIESCADRGVLEQVLLDCGYEPQSLTLNKSGSARGMRNFRAIFETEEMPIAG